MTDHVAAIVSGIVKAVPRDTATAIGLALLAQAGAVSPASVPDGDRPAIDSVPGDRSMTIQEFCDAERISRGHYENLRAIGRGAREMKTGHSVRISHEARMAWRRDMELRPIAGGVRAKAEAARAAKRVVVRRAAETVA